LVVGVSTIRAVFRVLGHPFAKTPCEALQLGRGNIGGNPLPQDEDGESYERSPTQYEDDVFSIQERSISPTVDIANAVRECVHCGRRLKNPKARYYSPACYVRSKERRERRRAAGLPTVPTPAEIAAECLEIQKTWSAAEFAQRAPHLAPVRWELLCVPRAGLG
jgi:hypothetical protein